MKSTELFSIPSSPPPSIVVQWAERESYRRRNGIYRLHLRVDSQPTLFSITKWTWENKRNKTTTRSKKRNKQFRNKSFLFRDWLQTSQWSPRLLVGLFFFLSVELLSCVFCYFVVTLRCFQDCQLRLLASFSSFSFVGHVGPASPEWLPLTFGVIDLFLVASHWLLESLPATKRTTNFHLSGIFFLARKSPILVNPLALLEQMQTSLILFVVFVLSYSPGHFYNADL